MRVVISGEDWWQTRRLPAARVACESPVEEGKMGLYKENPRYKCVSMRLSDDEWEKLTLVCSRKSKNMSECLREALAALLLKNDLNEEMAEASG